MCEITSLRGLHADHPFHGAARLIRCGTSWQAIAARIAIRDDTGERLIQFMRNRRTHLSEGR